MTDLAYLEIEETTPNNGDVATYDSADGRWKPAAGGGGGGGEANTASNVGVGGVGLFNAKVGVDLQFKNINASSSRITVTNDAANKEVDIDAVEANFTLNNIGGTLNSTKGGTGVNSSASTGVPRVSAGTWSVDATTTHLAEGSNLYYTDERVDDRVAALLVAGTGIGLSYNDAGNSLTVSSTITQYTDELAQDAVGNILTDSGRIDFTYNDAANTITADIVAGSIMNSHINASAAIALSKLATDPLARANHTGTQLSSTISDFSSAVVALLTDANIPNTITLDNITQITTRSHASLQSLSVDDHTQYLLLAGRSGGQTANGGTAASDNLTYYPNSAAFASTNSGKHIFKQALEFANTETLAPTSGGIFLNWYLMRTTGTWTYGAAVIAAESPVLKASHTIEYPTAQVLTSGVTFDANVTLKPSGALADGANCIWAGYFSRNVYSPFVSTAAAATTPRLSGYWSFPQVTMFAGSHASATATVTRLDAYCAFDYVGGGFNMVTNNCTVTTASGFWMRNPSKTGSGAITNVCGLDVDDITAGGTLNAAIRSLVTSGTGKYFIYATGSAKSVIAGEVRIGDTTVPTALVEIAGSSTARSSLNVVAGTSPTTPVSGDIWHDSTQKALIKSVAGVKQTTPGVLYTSTADGTIGNSTTETTVIGTGVGTKTLPANFFVAGKTIRVRVFGYYSTKAAPVGTFTLRCKLGSTAIETVTPTLTASMTSRQWSCEFLITCRTTGVSGTVYGQGELRLFTAAATVVGNEALSTATTTIDTTASQTVEVTAQWGTANASNTITGTNAIIEVLN